MCSRMNKFSHQSFGLTMDIHGFAKKLLSNNRVGRSITSSDLCSGAILKAICMSFNSCNNRA